MSKLELFGDWLYFNGERLARLEPGADHGGRRMLLEEHLNAQHGKIDMTNEWSAKVLMKDGRVLYEIVTGADQPFLPPGTYVEEVVTVTDLSMVLDKIDMKLDL